MLLFSSFLNSSYLFLIAFSYYIKFLAHVWMLYLSKIFFIYFGLGPLLALDYESSENCEESDEYYGTLWIFNLGTIAGL